MTDKTHTSEELAMARQCAVKTLEARGVHSIANDVRHGRCDEHAAVQSALLAIQATTEAAAKLVDDLNASGPFDAIGAASRLRESAHLKGNHHDSI